MRDVAVHLILFALVEDFVVCAGVEPAPKLELTRAHITGDEALNPHSPDNVLSFGVACAIQI